MRQELHPRHLLDQAGNPAGGSTTACGLAIDWQNGPLVDPESGERRLPNGCFTETVIEAAIDRLRFYQTTKFVSDENECAIEYLCLALGVLNRRTKRRQARGVEGTHRL